MNWHIIGANGFIGTMLQNAVSDKTNLKCYDLRGAGGIDQIDLTDCVHIDFSPFRAGDYAVVLAAVSSPDMCTKQYDYAYSVNVIGTTKFIQTLIDRGVNVLFFSSDVVYGSTGLGKLDEAALCNPTGAYAEMKYCVERAFAGCPNFKVFRLSYVFSRRDKFSKYLRSCVENDVEAEVFDSFSRSIVYIQDIIEAVMKLSVSFTQFQNQIFNLCGPELLSRKAVAEIFKSSVAPTLRYRVSEPPEGFFDSRPARIATKSLYLCELLKREPTYLQLAMQREFCR